MWRLLAVTLALAACTPSPAPPGHAGDDLRIATLAPHLAELVHAAGAGERLVGVSSYSDYPEAVRSLPVIGDAFMIDQERLAMLRPDLLLAWESGTPAHVVDELRARGHRVEVIRTRGLADVMSALTRIGRLAGSEARATAAADAFHADWQALARQWQDATPIRVFYQISQRPLYTVNGEHYVSELIALCGGSNIFADLGELAPMVSEEAVLDRDPEVLLAAAVSGDDPFAPWQRWSGLAANRYDNHYVVPAAEIGRATPRLLDAGRAVCERLQRARERRQAVSR